MKKYMIVIPANISLNSNEDKTSKNIVKVIYMLLLATGISALLLIILLIVSSLNQTEPDIVIPEAPSSFIRQEQKIIRAKEFKVPNTINGSFKSWMDYRTITSKYSKQWKLQQEAQTDGGGLRIYKDNPMIAVGTYYADEVGKTLRITLDSGKIFDAVVGDIKSDKDTDNTHSYMTVDGSIVEFIVDKNKLCNTSKHTGNMSHSGYSGKIIKIEEVIVYE